MPNVCADARFLWLLLFQTLTFVVSCFIFLTKQLQRALYDGPYEAPYLRLFSLNLYPQFWYGAVVVVRQLYSLFL